MIPDLDVQGLSPSPWAPAGPVAVEDKDRRPVYSVFPGKKLLRGSEAAWVELGQCWPHGLRGGRTFGTAAFGRAWTGHVCQIPA